MQQQLQQQGQGPIQQMRNTMGWVAFACRAMGTTVEVFLHEPASFGARYIGINAVIGAAILLLFPVFWPDADPGPMLSFFCLFLVACMLARAASAAKRMRGGCEEHSFYSGRPWLLRVLRRKTELDIKGAVEPVLVWITAITTISINEPIGTYLFLAGAAQLITVRMSIAYERTRALDMHDALMEQRRVAEEWRRMRQD